MGNPLLAAGEPPLAGLASEASRPLARRLRPFVLGMASLLLLTGAGLAHGARLAIGTEGVLALATATQRRDPPRTRQLERDPLHGSWWRPEGSSAQRPQPRLELRVWQPRREP